MTMPVVAISVGRKTAAEFRNVIFIGPPCLVTLMSIANLVIVVND